MTFLGEVVTTKLGKEVRRLREERNLSLDQLAGRAGISRLTVLHLEQGRASTRLFTLEQIADALDCRLVLEPYPMPEDYHGTS